MKKPCDFTWGKATLCPRWRGKDVLEFMNALFFPFARPYTQNLSFTTQNNASHSSDGFQTGQILDDPEKGSRFGSWRIEYFGANLFNLWYKLVQDPRLARREWLPYLWSFFLPVFHCFSISVQTILFFFWGGGDRTSLLIAFFLIITLTVSMEEK